MDGSPLTRFQFCSLLNKTLEVAGLPNSRYKSHSFRIGAASDSFSYGHSETEIKKSKVDGVRMPSKGSEKVIWIVGSSIIKWAFYYARKSLDGVDLGLRRRNYRIFWQGKGGMKWFDLIPKIKLLLRYESPPEILIIHCGGNDIGKIPLLQLRSIMSSALEELKQLLPKTTLVWSNMLPRISWRFSSNSKAQNLATVRLNNFMNHLITVNGGFFIKYPEITWDSKEMFSSDGVHLSYFGNCFLLFNLQRTLQECVLL
ncbi:uncharacterized protein LOC133191607 [Saccostrea echinata]|uniref:uncharacterized protein LOC133191607 n=1 Tax=Saccostrea echinata TaxID=191078 RepID=UPI002A7F8523|nr:uncharacterized protein LOC133191607 [Saccostrea echinata]